MLCEPVARVEAVSWAWPFPPMAADPIMEVPSWKLTKPVGVPPVLAVTTAVKVTGVPTVAGFGDEVRLVVVEA